MSTPERGRIGLLVDARLGIALLALSAVVGCSAVRTPRPIAPDASPLRVGTSGDYAPFSTRAADGTLAGFDVEVARAYAAERGRTIVFLPFRWPELGSRLVAGDFDIVMSGVTVRPDRLIAGIMTATVARADAVLVVAASSSHATSTGAAQTVRRHTRSMICAARSIAWTRASCSSSPRSRRLAPRSRRSRTPSPTTTYQDSRPRSRVHLPARSAPCIPILERSLLVEHPTLGV